jgi:hypothetical protein
MNWRQFNWKINVEIEVRFFFPLSSVTKIPDFQMPIVQTVDEFCCGFVIWNPHDIAH